MKLITTFILGLVAFVSVGHADIIKVKHYSPRTEITYIEQSTVYYVERPKVRFIRPAPVYYVERPAVCYHCKPKSYFSMGFEVNPYEAPFPFFSFGFSSHHHHHRY